MFREIYNIVINIVHHIEPLKHLGRENYFCRLIIGDMTDSKKIKPLVNKLGSSARHAEE